MLDGWPRQGGLFTCAGYPCGRRTRYRRLGHDLEWRRLKIGVTTAAMRVTQMEIGACFAMETAPSSLMSEPHQTSRPPAARRRTTINYLTNKPAGPPRARSKFMPMLFGQCFARRVNRPILNGTPTTPSRIITRYPAEPSVQNSTGKPPNRSESS